ncbi:hypothetical protein [Methylobacterium sp. MA0201]|uniref:hypothetical protein n=1 Tax=Methylobacterium alsaeris TaxID=3344826 RepID=UPI003757EEA6
MARTEAQQASVAEAKASKAVLDKLLRQSVEKRFAAFESESGKLTPADRRTLLASIKNADLPAQRAPLGGTASRFAVWRARLPYQVGGMAASGIALGLAAIGLIVAIRNTPSHAVEIVTTYPVPAQFRRADGVIVADRLEPRTRYVAMSERGGQTLLRLWLPRQGYATASVPSDWLRPALPARSSGAP